MHSVIIRPVLDCDSMSANRQAGTATGKSGDLDSTAKFASEVIIKRALSHSSLSKFRENLINSRSGKFGSGISYATVSNNFLPVPPTRNSSASTIQLTLLSVGNAPEAWKALVRKSV